MAPKISNPLDVLDKEKIANALDSIFTDKTYNDIIPNINEAAETIRDTQLSELEDHTLETVHDFTDDMEITLENIAASRPVLKEKNIQNGSGKSGTEIGYHSGEDPVDQSKLYAYLVMAKSFKEEMEGVKETWDKKKEGKLMAIPLLFSGNGTSYLTFHFDEHGMIIVRGIAPPNYLEGLEFVVPYFELLAEGRLFTNIADIHQSTKPLLGYQIKYQTPAPLGSKRITF